jgi:hypothetical protein
LCIQLTLLVDFCNGSTGEAFDITLGVVGELPSDKVADGASGLGAIKALGCALYNENKD